MFHFEISCNHLLSFWVMVLLCLTFTPLHSHAQCPKPGNQDNVVPTDDNKEEYLDGSSITYECIPGYKRIRGSPTITCSNGTWSRLTLLCQKKSCGPPPDVVNGEWVGDDLDFGASISLKCNTGYTVAGKISTMQCESEGWNGKGFLCEAVRCPLPPHIQNGNYFLSGDKEYLLFQELVTYSCEASYTLFGKSELVCTENGTYNTQPPECRKVNCPQPVVEFGTRVEGGPPPYGHRSFIVYECNEGYKMNGSARIVCEDNVWSPKPPVCQKIVNCAQPKVDFGTQVGGDSSPYVQGSFIVYKCNEGYKMNGSAKIVCEDSIWAPKPPVCQRIVNCAQPKVDFGTQVGGGSPPYVQGSFIVYKCNEGYKMNGSAKIVCEDNIWSSKPPVCQRIVNCAQPRVDFGTQVVGGSPPFGQGSFIVYECNEGYKMNGSAKIFCEDNIWSPKPPVCQRSGASCTGSLCTEVYRTLVQRVLLALLIPVGLHLSI